MQDTCAHEDRIQVQKGCYDKHIKTGSKKLKQVFIRKFDLVSE